MLITKLPIKMKNIRESKKTKNFPLRLLHTRQQLCFRFDISNTEHVKQVELLDRVTILCPQPISGRRYEFSKLYMVGDD